MSFREPIPGLKTQLWPAGIGDPMLVVDSYNPSTGLWSLYNLFNSEYGQGLDFPNAATLRVRRKLIEDQPWPYPIDLGDEAIAAAVDGQLRQLPTFYDNGESGSVESELRTRLRFELTLITPPRSVVTAIERLRRLRFSSDTYRLWFVPWSSWWNGMEHTGLPAGYGPNATPAPWGDSYDNGRPADDTHYGAGSIESTDTFGCYVIPVFSGWLPSRVSANYVTPGIRYKLVLDSVWPEATTWFDGLRAGGE